jgi:hypothetical protein
MTTPHNRPASPIDDEGLSALLDDELTAEDAQRLRLRLLSDPALAARLDALENATATARRAFARIADEALPPQLLQLLREDEERDVRRAAWWPRGRRAWRWLAAPALVAPFVFGLGAALGPRLGGSANDTETAAPGPIAADSALFELLERTPAGERVALGRGRSGTATLTFATPSGRYCRRIELGDATGAPSAALACRTASGWHVEASFERAADATVDAAVALRSSAPPLDGAAERELIARGWPQPVL